MQNLQADGLEIISIGSLYKGAWDKKYWSSSRGKDRYPYTIGYHAVRTHNGITYKMEICEGIKGPSFRITSTDGESCSGQTPDIAWESFQKKSAPRAKIGHGKRFSCKIDGVEFFGFRNALVQRMLRELISNVNGKPERNLSSVNLSNKSGRVEPDTQPSVSRQPPDLLPLVVKPPNTNKRSRKDKNATIHAGIGLDPKEPPREPDLLKELKPIDFNDSKFTAPVINFSKEEQLIDMVLDADPQQCMASKTAKADTKGIVSFLESKNIKNSDLCVPDSYDFLHGFSMQTMYPMLAKNAKLEALAKLKTN